MEILIIVTLGLMVVVDIIRNFSHRFKIAYYETLLERIENEAGRKLPDNYYKVKSDFWAFIKL